MSQHKRKLPNISILVLGLACCITSSAHAAGFIGDYAISNWVEGGGKVFSSVPEPGKFYPEEWLLGDPGVVNTFGAPDTISLRAHTNGPDAPEIPPVRSTITFTTIAVTNGEVIFDWNHFASGSAPLESFGFILNDTRLTLDDTDGNYHPGSAPAYSPSGSENLLVNAGDTFGFFAQSYDGFNGFAIGTVSNFSVTPIPVPPTLSLILSVLGLLGWVRKGRRK